MYLTLLLLYSFTFFYSIVCIFTGIFKQTLAQECLSYLILFTADDTVGLQVTDRVNTRFILIIRLMFNQKVQKSPQRLNSHEIKPAILQIMLQFTIHASNCQTCLH